MVSSLVFGNIYCLFVTDASDGLNDSLTHHATLISSILNQVYFMDIQFSVFGVGADQK